MYFGIEERRPLSNEVRQSNATNHADPFSVSRSMSIHLQCRSLHLAKLLKYNDPTKTNHANLHFTSFMSIPRITNHVDSSNITKLCRSMLLHNAMSIPPMPWRYTDPSCAMKVCWSLLCYKACRSLLCYADLLDSNLTSVFLEPCIVYLSISSNSDFIYTSELCFRVLQSLFRTHRPW